MFHPFGVGFLNRFGLASGCLPIFSRLETLPTVLVVMCLIVFIYTYIISLVIYNYFLSCDL